MRTIETDILIVGAGIAGLWTLALARAHGHDALLLERDAPGAGQTIASQGIIHGGVKYALTGAATRASRAIADMPAQWRDALAGRGAVNLSEARTLSNTQYLWTTGSFVSNLAGAAAGLALRTGVSRLDRPDFPPAFADAPRSTRIYATDEPVLDTASVVRALTLAHADSILIASPTSIHTERDGAAVQALAGQQHTEALEIRAASLVLAAGAGNDELLRLAGLVHADEHVSQRRPLHMVMVRSPRLPPLFAHCVAASTLPRLTVTSATDEAGRTVWYIGGALAESGVERSRGEQIESAREELSACLAWVNLSDAQWATLRIDRAEGLTPDGSRPDEPVVRRFGQVVALWPTKLAFAPLAAQRALESLPTSQPRAAAPRGPAPGDTSPRPAPPPWGREDVQWN